MNPRIHSPGWYGYVKLIDADEIATAANSPGTLITPPLSQFRFSDITIACHQDRWEIQTTQMAGLDRVKKITADVFDEYLKHTPVSVIGFNFNYKRETIVQSVSSSWPPTSFLMNLGLRSDDISSGKFSVRRSIDSRSCLIAVSPSDSSTPNHIEVANNFEYKLSGDEPGTIDLMDTISARYEADRLEAEAQTTSIIQAINQSRE